MSVQANRGSTATTLRLGRRITPQKRNHVFLAFPCDLKRSVFTTAEERMFLTPQLPARDGSPKLRPAIREIAEHFAAYCGGPSSAPPAHPGHRDSQRADRSPPAAGYPGRPGQSQSSLP